MTVVEGLIAVRIAISGTIIVSVMIISMRDLVGCLFVSIGVDDLMRDSFLMVIFFMVFVMGDLMVGMFSLCVFDIGLESQIVVFLVLVVGVVGVVLAVGVMALVRVQVAFVVGITVAFGKVLAAVLTVVCVVHGLPFVIIVSVVVYWLFVTIVRSSLMVCRHV